VKREDVYEMAKDPRYISGIYNYCDRWCERCPFTSRCLNQAMEEELDEEHEGDPSELRDVQNDKFWKHMESVFKMTLDMLEEMMEREGIELGPEEMDQIAQQERVIEEEAENHELAQLSNRYAELVDEWFEAEADLFKEKSKDLLSRSQMELGDDDPEGEALAIIDAVEVLRWYQYQIYVKLKRALTQDGGGDEPEDEEDDPIQTDSNGSAKVALIGIDRSIAAWGELREHLPQKADGILNILRHLDRLRRRAEETFADARKFQRPGFDDDVPKFEVD